MTDLIKITDNDGKQVVSARELYIGLGYDISNYAKWCKNSITENPYFCENEDWVLLVLDNEYTGRGQKAKDYALSITMAKKLAMMAKTEVGNKYRDYFIACEKKLKEQTQHQLPQTFAQALALAAEQALRIEEQQKAIEEKEARVSRLIHDSKTYTSGEIAKELGLRSATELNNILKERKIHFKQNDTWLLYADYSDLGYTSTKQIVLDNGHIIYDRRWTGKGRDFIIDLLK